MSKPARRCPCCQSSMSPAIEDGLPCIDCIHQEHTGQPNCPACTRNLEAVLRIAQDMIRASSMPTKNASRELRPAIKKTTKSLTKSSHMASKKGG